MVVEDIQAQEALTQARSDYLTGVAEYDKAQDRLEPGGGQPA